MAVVQDVFNSQPGTAYPGMVANGETSNRISRNVEDAAGIAFGAPVFAGATDRGCTKTVKTVDDFLGFVMADHGQPVVPGGPAADVLPQYRSAGIMDRGTIYVTVTGAGAKRALLYVAADGSLSTTSAGGVLTNWRLDDTITGTGVARIGRR